MSWIGSRARWLAALGLLGSLFAPVLWVCATTRAIAVGDIALIELRTRDVFSGHPPLLGAYSRYGWGHPGAIAFDAMALPYRLFGADGDAMRLSALVVNALVVVAIGVACRHRGRAAQAAVLGSVVLLVWGFGPNMLSDSWNATMSVLPFLLTIVACWCALCGDRLAWSIAAVAATFTFQTHAGFGIVLIPIVVATLATLVVRARREGVAVPARSVAIGLGCAAVASIPLIADTVLHWPGNLGTLVRWSASNDQPTVGLVDSLRYIGRTSSLSFPLHAQFPNQFLFTYSTISSGFLPGVLLILLAVAGVVSVRRRMTAEAQWCGCLALTWLGAVLACANIATPIGYWLIGWLQPLAWLTWACIAVVAWRLMRAQWPSARPSPWTRSSGRVAIVLSLVIVLVVGTTAYARAVVGDHRAESSNALVAQLTDAAFTVGTDQPVRIEFDASGFGAGPMMFAVANQLDARGMQICVDRSWALYFGASRVCSGRTDFHLLVRDETLAVDTPGNAELLTLVDQLDADDRREVETLTADLGALLVRNGLSDQVGLLTTELADLAIAGQSAPDLTAHADDFARLTELRRRPGSRFSVFLVYDLPPN